MTLSWNFVKFIGRLLLAGIIILISSYLGSVLFIADTNEELAVAKIKNLSEELDNLPLPNIKLHVGSSEMALSSKITESWFETYTRSYSGKKDVRIKSEKIGEYLLSIAPSVNIEPVNAKLILVNGKAEEFVPPEYGYKLDIDKSKRVLIDTIIHKKNEATLPVNLVEPAVTLNKINELGITTLIGRGESDFKGSPSSRIHNIKIGSAKYNGLVLKPGEIFSFNSILGEVDESNGYQSELVIKKGELVYEYGGGLCQVSTTLFRSAVMAGLPIIERKPHSFPVRYYDPQGFDATIYPGIVDLEFKNDTSNHILIQSKIEGSKLTFDIYGPDEKRQVSLDGPHQYDKKQNGSMKAFFTRKITFADGSIKENRFDSSYSAPAPLEKNPLE